MVGVAGNSTFDAADFNAVFDDICQFHPDDKHKMRDCEELKRRLGAPREPKRLNEGDGRPERRYNDNRRPNDRYR